MSRNYTPDREVLYIGPPPVNRLGKRGLWTSLFGLFTCGLLSPIGLVMSFLALSKKPRGAAAAGVLFGLLGSAWIVFVGSLVAAGVMSEAARKEAHLRTSTKSAMVQAEGVIEHYRSETSRLPAGIEGNKLVLSFTDAWNNALRYDLDDPHYVIRSAGPDGQFDTEDDLTHAGGAHPSVSDDDDD